MLVRQPKYNGVGTLAVLVIIGLAVEAAVWIVAQYWATRYGTGALTLGPVVFGVAAGGLYLGTQVLSAMYAIDLVPGLSLSLLATMLAWVVALGALLLLAFFLVLALYALVGVPARILADVIGR